MQIRLNEKEISEAIAAYIAKNNSSITHTGAMYVHSSPNDIHILVDVITEKPKPMVTFASVDQWPDIATGSSLQGTVEVSYKRLVEVFGEHKDLHDDYKSDAEWWIKFGDGTFATIYNWKDGKNYNGDDGMEVEDITDWHIGGADSKSVEMVYKALGKEL